MNASPPAAATKIRIAETSDRATIAKICRLRAEVWAATGCAARDAFPDNVWRDALDQTARHWAAWNERGELIGAARLSIQQSMDEVTESAEYLAYDLSGEGPVAAPDRVVVHRAAAGSGVGSRLLDLQDSAILESGAAVAVRQASPAMCRLLQRRGWRLMGPATQDPRFPGIRFTVAVKPCRDPEQERQC